MTKKERYAFVVNYFLKHSPDAETELIYENAYQLLVAVILSAQCTDKRVNVTTPDFFKKYPDISSLGNANDEDVLQLVKSISYPNNKTRHLIEMAKNVMEKFNGNIPMTVDELIQLPGVGRKTANVITSVIDNQPNMAVDTHVFRVSARIGLSSNSKTPLDTEKQLLRYLPVAYVRRAHHWLILHGRYICLARSPRCNICGLKVVCMFYNNNIIHNQKI